jgi:hypothetical protein
MAHLNSVGQNQSNDLLILLLNYYPKMMGLLIHRPPLSLTYNFNYHRLDHHYLARPINYLKVWALL